MTWHALRLFGTNKQAFDAIESVRRMRGGSFIVQQPMRRVYRPPQHGKERAPLLRPLYHGWAFVSLPSPNDRYILGCCSLARIIGPVPDDVIEPILSAGPIDEGFPRRTWAELKKGHKLKLIVGRLGEILVTYEGRVDGKHVVASPFFGGRMVTLTQEQIEQAEAAE